MKQLILVVMLFLCYFSMLLYSTIRPGSSYQYDVTAGPGRTAVKICPGTVTWEGIDTNVQKCNSSKHWLITFWLNCVIQMSTRK